MLMRDYRVIHEDYEPITVRRALDSHSKIIIEQPDSDTIWLSENSIDELIEALKSIKENK